MEFLSVIAEAVHKSVVLVLLMGFLLAKNKKPWVQLFLAVPVAVCFNSFLKGIFQIPLPDTFPIQPAPAVWAFPSGHVSMAVFFWTFLALQLQRRYLFALAVLCPSIEIVNVLYYGYHDLKDVLGGIASGAILTTALHYFFKHPIAQNMTRTTLISLCVTILMSGLTPNLFEIDGPWRAMGLLSGFLIGHMLLPMPEVQPTIWQRLWALVFGIVIFFGYKTFTFRPEYPIAYYLIKSALTTFLVFSVVPSITQKIYPRYRSPTTSA